MIKRGEINSRGATIESSQVHPASLDLRLGIVAYRVRASFLTGKNFYDHVVAEIDLLNKKYF